MSEGGAPTPAHPNMLRNVLTGVITTVLGATVVYFLGFHSNSGRPSPGSYLEIKEATTNAWKSYVTLENIEYKFSLSLAENMKNMNSFDKVKTEIGNESRKFTGDVENILKNKDIDDAFVALLKRRLDAEKESLDLWNTFFDECKDIQNTTEVGEERNQRANAALNKLQTSGDIILKRTKTEITDLSKSLNEKYGQQFSIAELMLFKDEPAVEKKDDKVNPGGTVIDNPKDNPPKVDYTTVNTVVSKNNFVGEWDYQIGVINFYNDGRMSMQGNNGQSASGTWQYSNNQIAITYPNEYGISMTYVYNYTLCYSDLARKKSYVFLKDFFV